MKKLLLLLLISPLFISCEKNDDKLGDSDNILGHNKKEGYITIDNISDVDNVEIWSKESELSLNDYYSLIDTIKQRTIVRSTKYYCEENEEPDLEWKVNGKSYQGTETSKIWKGDYQKWLVTNTIIIDLNQAPISLKIEFNIKFNDGEGYRLKTIPQINIIEHESDIFGFTFGESRKNINVTRDLDNSLSVKYDELKKSAYFLEFTNGILKKLYYCPYYKDDLITFCEKLHNPKPTTMIFGNSYYLISNPQEWSTNKLELATLNLDLSKYKLGVQACVSFEKK